MTEKELTKLNRHDLLSLLVAQGREAAELQTQFEETQAQLTQELELGARLRTRLNEKDEQLARLKSRLDEKDAQIEGLKAKLNDKDALIERLKGRLDEKDHSIMLLRRQVNELAAGEYMQLDSATSLAEVTVKLNLMLRTAQAVANRYLHDIQAPSGNNAAAEGTAQNR